MPTRLPTRATALLCDERGANSMEWMFPALILVVLSVTITPQMAGHWEHARTRLPVAISAPILDLLP